MYVVEGNVIEMANGTASTSTSSAVAVYPVTLELQSIDNHWLITKVTKGARSELPQVQMISGTLLCLKQKDPSAPKLEGCSYGIATLQGSSTYAVSTSTMSTSTPAFKLGTKVRVTGLVTPANQLDSIPQYQFDGIISATEIQKI
jgi:hypothetical protein